MRFIVVWGMFVTLTLFYSIPILFLQARAAASASLPALTVISRKKIPQCLISSPASPSPLCRFAPVIRHWRS